MATAYKKSLAATRELTTTLTELSNDSSADIVARKAAADAAVALLEETTAVVAKLTAKAEASMKDPENRVYGPNTCKKIMALAEEFKAVEALAERVLPDIRAAWDAHAAAQAAEAEAAKAAAEAEAAAKAAAAKAEEERQRAEAEAAAAAAAAARAAELAEIEAAKAAAAARKKAKEEAQKAAEAERKAEEERLAAAKAEKEAQKAKAAEEKRLERQRKIEQATEAAKAAAAAQAEAAAAAAPPPAPTSTVLPTGSVHHVQGLAALRAAIAGAGSKPVLVDWYAPWCRPCRMIAPVLDSMAGATKEVLFLKIDGDAFQEACIAEGVRAFPTFQMYRKGVKTQQFTGAQEAAINNAIEQELLQVVLEQSMQDDFAPKAAAAPAATTAAAPTAAAAPAPAPAASTEAGVPTGNSGLDKALRVLRSKCARTEYVAALKALSRCASNIVKHPEDAKYRKMRCANTHFHARIGRLKGGVACCEALGFALSQEAEGGDCLLMSAEAAANKELADMSASLEKLVAECKKPAVAPAVPPPVAAAAPAQAPAAAAAAANPFAGIPGMAGLPGMGGMPGMPGMPPGMPNMDPATMMRMMSNPHMQSIMQQLQSNPDLMRDVASGNMGALMQNPQLMSQLMGAMGSMGGMPGMPAAGGGGAAAAANPFAAMMGGGGAGNPFAAMMGGGAAAPGAPAAGATPWALPTPGQATGAAAATPGSVNATAPAAAAANTEEEKTAPGDDDDDSDDDDDDLMAALQLSMRDGAPEDPTAGSGDKDGDSGNGGMRRRK